MDEKMHQNEQAHGTKMIREYDQNAGVRIVTWEKRHQ